METLDTKRGWSVPGFVPFE